MAVQKGRMIAKLLPYPSEGANRRQAVIGKMAIKCDWIDAGKYDVTREAVKKAITLCDVQISFDIICCEYKDSDLFGGHRMHALFDHDYKLISADV